MDDLLICAQKPSDNVEESAKKEEAVSLYKGAKIQQTKIDLIMADLSLEKQLGLIPSDTIGV